MSGQPVNLAGNVNALLLMNLGGENVQFGADNNVRMDIVPRQGATTATGTGTGTATGTATQPTVASQPAAVVGGS